MKRTTLGMLALAAYGFAASALAGEDTPTLIPEPGMLALIGVGLVAVVVVRLRGRK